MKRLFTLWVLIFIRWQAFSSDCNLTFEDKTPSHIISQMEEIYLMDMEIGLVCFNELKNFLIEPIQVESENVESEIKDIINGIKYRHKHRENIIRAQHLMSSLMDILKDNQDISSPPIHPEIPSKHMYPIRITLTQITQKISITGKPVLPDDKLSYLDRQIERLQPRRQQIQQLNSYFFLPMFIPIPSERTPILQGSFHTSETQEIANILNIDSTTDQKPKQSFKEEYIWTETFQVEFPSVLLCKKHKDERSKLFYTTFKNYEAAIAEFTDSHTDIKLLYINIMEWLDSIRNQNGYNLQDTRFVFNFIAFSTQLNQIPDFITSSMTPEQTENFNHMVDLIRRYMWMYNLYFEYRKCLPVVFREHLLFSYSVPVPLEITPDSRRLSGENLNISLSDINLLYEFSAYTAPFVSSAKQSYPLHLFRQKNVSWNDFISNNNRSRYEPNWQNIIEFLKHWISTKRMHLNVSF